MLERISQKESVAPVKREKTKEELTQLRKEMMKRRPATAKAATTTSIKDEKPHPKAALMERLASGKRAGVSGKEMHRRTNQNYAELPEVRRKREAEEKKAELLRR